jgi:hypothetical protein
MRSSGACIANMSEFEFLVHTGSTWTASATIYAPDSSALFDLCAGVMSQDAVHRKHTGSSRSKLVTRVCAATVQRLENCGVDLDRQFNSTIPSARASSGSGTERPSALAVLRLTIISNLVDLSTGRSVGLTHVAARQDQAGPVVLKW